MDKIDKLSKFLEENFPEKAEEIKNTLIELQEVMLSTNLEISESMPDLMLDNKYNKARNFIDKSEDISNYIKNLEDIINLVSSEKEADYKIVSEEKDNKEPKLEINKTPQMQEEAEIFLREENEESILTEDKEENREEEEKVEFKVENDISQEEVIEEINTKEIRKQVEQEENKEESEPDKISAQEISQMFEDEGEAYNNQENNVHYLDENFREKEPSAFYIDEEGKEVESWSDMLVETCKLLKNRDPDKFVAFINDDDFKFISRSYFSYNKDQIKEPEPMQLKNRKIYIETKLSPNVVNKLIQKLVNKYGIDQKSYKIYYKDDNSVSSEGKKIS